MRLAWLALLCLAAPAPAAAAPLEPDELPPEVYVDRSGFAELVIQNTVLGPLVGLTVTQALFGADERVRGFSGFYLGLGAGVVLPIVLTHDEPLPAAQATYLNFGERFGLLNGLLVPYLWGSGYSRDHALGASVGFGLGLGGAIATWPALRLSPGEASALGTAQLFGLATGALLMLSFDVVPHGGTSFAAPLLLFSNAGVAGVLLTRDLFAIDRRRVFVVDLGGLGGMLVGTGVGFLIAGGEDWRAKGSIYGSAMLAGMLAGLGFGYVASSGLDEYEAGVPLGVAPTLLPGAPGAPLAVGLALTGAL